VTTKNRRLRADAPTWRRFLCEKHEKESVQSVLTSNQVFPSWSVVNGCRLQPE